jgi:hypothetical protein
MPTPKYLFTTYTSAQDALNTIDAWLVTIMGYTRNLAPTADSVTYTGYKAHYQYSFVTGETLFLNFHTDTTNSRLYLTTSRAYSSSMPWNAQSGTAQVLSGDVIYGYVNIPTASANNALYLFGDAFGNCQLFVQRGSDLAASDLLQWGLLDKSGFGTWTGGCFFDSWQIPATTLSATSPAPYILNISNASEAPASAIDITSDTTTTWAGLKSIADTTATYNFEPSATIGTTSSSWSSIIVAAGSGAYGKSDITTTERHGSGASVPSAKVNVSEDFVNGYVNMLTGRIVLGPNPTLYVRHESTQRLSPIGRMPFGYQCPIAGFYRYVAPGTQLAQDGRTFIMMGNIAAEMVSV